MDQRDYLKQKHELARRADAGDAWALAAMRAAPPIPPSALGRLHDEARALAEQVARTGAAWGWRTPPLQGEGVERLLFRMMLTLEAMMRLLTEAEAVSNEDRNHDG